MVRQTTLDLLDRLIRWSFYALILLLPVGIGFVSSFAAFAISFFWIKRICMVINQRPKGFAIFGMLFFPKSSFLNLPLLFFVLAAAISVVFSQNHGLSLMGFFGKLMRGVMLYASFLEAFTTIGMINQFIFSWIVSSCIVGLSGLSQYYFGFDFIRQMPLVGGRVASTMRQANDFGAYIVAICPLILSLLMHWDSINKELMNYIRKVKINSLMLICFLFLTYIICIFCLGLTFSRAAWVGFFLAILMLGFFKKESLPLIFIIIVGFIWFFTPYMIAARDSSLLADNVRNQRIARLEHKPIEDHSFIDYVLNNLGSGRFGFWQEATHIIHDYPWWGCGINTYSKMGAKYKINWGGYPHNSYLQLTAEMGALGLGTFLWMIIALYYFVIKYIRKIGKGYTKVIMIGALASLTAYLIQSFFDTTFYSVQLSVLLWILMGVLVAIARMNQLTNRLK